MTTKPETRRQRRIQKTLKEKFKGSFWIKIWSGPFQIAGFPDLLGCVEGRFFAFEVKEPGEVAKKHQERMMSKISRAGGTTGVIYEPEEAVLAIQETIQ